MYNFLIVKSTFLNFVGDYDNPDIHITEVALHISTYGAEELKQVLELMQIENDLFSCRPLKVVNYFRVSVFTNNF